MSLSAALTLSVLVAGASASHWRHTSNNCSAWDLEKFTSLVTFGDSYTDDSRAGYFAANNGTPPPVGYDNPANYNSASGGRPWPQYVKQYSGINLYNYAVSGAVCSNNITPRNFFPTFLFPSVEEYEVPAFVADSQYTKPDGTPFVHNPPDETVYSLWIGTNDLGNNALLTDSQVAGTNIVNYTDCVYHQLKLLYDHGGRYFVLQNLAPLHLAPMYATLENGGMQGPSRYWPVAPQNLTLVSGRMMEQVVAVNAIFEYQTPFVKRISNEFEDARFAVFDMHALISDIYYHPAAYLNGTAPLNVQSYSNKCNVTGGYCVRDSSPDSFLWFDALHPSEQTDRVIAREFIKVVKGASRWARYW